MSKLLTTVELEKKLQVTRQTILNWRKQGLPALKIGSAVRFDESAVDKWIEDQNK